MYGEKGMVLWDCTDFKAVSVVTSDCIYIGEEDKGK